jgi:HAD superfamily hydrolase (TIGR01509 family)
MQRIKTGFVVLSLSLIHAIYCTNNTQKPDEQKVTTVIFDVGGVLFQESKSTIIKKIGFGKLTTYALFNWTNPETTCLNTLNAISSQESKQPNIPLMLRGTKMPCCIIDWQLGRKSHLETRNILKRKIDKLDQKNFFKNSQEKELVLSMLEVSIDPLHLADIMQPVTSTVELAKQLKARNYKLIILANMAQEQYDLLTKTYPEITQLFDDIIVSSRVNLLKPHKEIYQHVLDSHRLKPQECVLIDSLKEHVQAAQQKGIRSILHKNIKTTRTSLAKLGV